MKADTKAEWIIAPRAPETFTQALRDLHPLTAQTLHARGFTDPDAARAFLMGTVPLVDPFALKDMPRAVERILAAIREGEAIAVYGDYDCDGVTSCALMMQTLNSLGAHTKVYIPDRFEEGYGLNAGALDKLKTQGVSLVITVDCGARAMQEAQHAKGIGLDLIITDHHELEDGVLPDALAVIDPRRADCAYPFKSLAGVGVAFRLAQCLLRATRDAGLPRARGDLTEASLLDYVAIGTVADVVPLTGENRPLVRAGLQRINAAPRVGVTALLRAAGMRTGEVNAGRIGFALGPRLNAAGRLESALAAYELLTCSDLDAAAELAAKLNQQNSERQSVTAQVTQDAERQALNGRSDASPLLFAASPEFNAGVIGLAAARLVEKHYRPAVVVGVSTASGEARGSCRSVNGFHITQALDECRDVLIRHGGHAAAAGFTMDAARVDELRQRMCAIAARERPANGWQRAIRADAELAMRDLTWQAFKELEQLEPHGMGNPKPAFVARRARVVNAYRMGKAEGDQSPPHLKLRLSDDRRVVWDAVAWRMGERIDEAQEGAVIDIVFRLDVNEWNGDKRLQLEVQDFRPA